MPERICIVYGDAEQLLNPPITAGEALELMKMRHGLVGILHDDAGAFCSRDYQLQPRSRYWFISGRVGAAGPKTIFINDPYSTPDTYDKTFKDERKFDKWLTRTNASGLFKYGQPPCIEEFEELEEGALYTLGASSVPARVTSLEKHKEHLVRRREQELASAILDDLVSEGALVVNIPEERVVKDGDKDVAEVDVAVRYTDASGQMSFVIGSMKTHVSGDSDVSSLQQKVEQHFAQRSPFRDHPTQLAFMAETVKAGQWDRLRAACKAKGVRLYARNGKGIGRVQLMSSRASISMW